MHTHKILGRRQIASVSNEEQPIFVIHVYKKNGGNYFKNFCHSVKNRQREGERERKLEWKQQKLSRFTKTQKINFSFFFHYSIQHDEDFGHTFSNKLFA